MFTLTNKDNKIAREDVQKEALEACSMFWEKYHECTKGRTITALVYCRESYKHLQNCMSPLSTEQHVDNKRFEILSKKT